MVIITQEIASFLRILEGELRRENLYVLNFGNEFNLEQKKRVDV